MVETTALAAIAAYVALWSAQTLLIKNTVKANGDYAFDKYTMTFLAELCKLIMASAYYFFWLPESPQKKMRELWAKREVLPYYAPPALLYCFYNALMFVNLTLFDPGTYRVLINVRIVTTGLAYQYLFQKQLGPKKWMALFILLIGLVAAQGNGVQVSNPLDLFSMFFQALCSSMAGVYFQWLLQRQHEISMSFWENNIFVYVWGVALNMTWIAVSRPDLLYSFDNFFANYDMSVMPILLVGSLGGFSTSFLLKYLNAVMKEYANGIEMLLVALLSWYLFGISLRVNLILGIVLVSVSLYIYNTAPPPQDVAPQAEAKSSRQTV